MYLLGTIVASRGIGQDLEEGLSRSIGFASCSSSISFICNLSQADLSRILLWFWPIVTTTPQDSTPTRFLSYLVHFYMKMMEVLFFFIFFS